MVSRRNFFSIFIMMAMLFFMFQFSQVFKALGNRYDVNEYAEGQVRSGEEQWQGRELRLEDPDLQEGSYVLFLGDTGNELGITVTQWCTYTKRNLIVLPDTKECSLVEGRLPEMILIDSNALDFRTETGNLIDMSTFKVPMIFCNLPSPIVVERREVLMGLLGISKVEKESVNLEGVHLFSGFLLGGEAVYKVRQEKDEELQDLQLDVPWYITEKGTKSYMIGMLSEEDEEAKGVPSLIWRNSYDGVIVFAVNGDYMSGLTGLGILDAFVYEMNSYELHPVVNAHNVMVADYPGFAAENEEELVRIYGRGSQAVLRDVMWPGISAMGERNKLKLTCYMGPQYDYMDEEEPSSDTGVFYLQQMKEIRAEAGKSLTHGSGVSLSEKLERDNAFYEEFCGDYCFSTVYVGEELPEGIESELIEGGALEGVRTLSAAFSGEYPLISYYTDQVTLQCATGRAEEYTYSKDLQARSLATALGYSNVLIDMHNVMWPDSIEDQWEHYFDKVSSNISTYWNQFKVYDRTVLSESDARVRTLLNLNYRTERSGDYITITVTNADDDAWFLLRTHEEEIDKAEGAEYQKVEKDIYLLHILSDQAQLWMKQSGDVLEYRF